MGAKEDIEAQLDAECLEIIEKAIAAAGEVRHSKLTEIIGEASMLNQGERIFDSEKAMSMVRRIEALFAEPHFHATAYGPTGPAIPGSEPGTHTHEMPPTLESRQADREMGYELATIPGMDWWKKYDPEHTESNWGRCCAICNQAVPAGRKEFHAHASPTTEELRKEWARFCHDNGNSSEMPTFAEWMHERETRKRR